MTILDVKGFPAKLLKDKDITLYKAFCPMYIKTAEDGYPELTIRKDIDILAITKEDAVAALIQEADVDTNFLGEEIVFVEVTFFTDELKKSDLVDFGEPTFVDGKIPITIKTKKYIINVSSKRLTEYKIDIGENEKKIISGITLVDM